MGSSPSSDLVVLRTGLRHLVNHPLTALGLAALSMCLSALAPWLQLRAGLPDGDLVEMSLAFAALLPLELFFIPRFVLELDATTLDLPANPAATWKEAFEQRWLRAFLAKVCLGLAAGLGFNCFILPGLFVLLAFGWAPLRVLLRGETLVEAARGSYRLMARVWPRAVFMGLVLVLAAITSMVVLGMAETALMPKPTAWLRLTRPSMWAFNFVAALVSLWLSTSLLALYQRLEATPSEPAPGAQEP